MKYLIVIMLGLLVSCGEETPEDKWVLKRTDRTMFKINKRTGETYALSKGVWNKINNANEKQQQAYDRKWVDRP